MGGRRLREQKTQVARPDGILQTIVRHDPDHKRQQLLEQETDIPLTGEEEKKYEKKNIAILQKSDTGNIQRYLKITEKLTNTINLDYKTTRLKYSGILNPFQLVIRDETVSRISSRSVSARHSNGIASYVSTLRSVSCLNGKNCSSSSGETGNIFLRSGEP